MGIKVADSEKEAHINYLRALTAYMQQWHPKMPVEELRLAYQLGVLGKYSEEKIYGRVEMYATINPVLINKVLVAYRTYLYEEYKRGTKTQPITDTGKLLADGALSAQGVEEQWFQFELRRAYVMHQQGQSYQDTGNALYDMLDGRKLVPFTDERKWEFMEAAQRLLLKDKQREAAKGYSVKANAARTLANVLKDAIDKGKLLVSQQGDIKNRAKQLALDQLLSDLIEQGVTVEEFLTINQE